jgi:hypothetical protein
MDRRAGTGAHDGMDDDAAAGAARARIRRHGLVPLQPDALAASVVPCGEHLFAVRPGARIECSAPSGPSMTGTLYLTARRLVLAGGQRFEVPLEEIRDTGIAGDLLLLLLRGGGAVAIGVDRPRLLRVEVAAARAAARRSRVRVSGEVAEPRGGLGAVADAQLVDDAADVVLHRARRDGE